MLIIYKTLDFDILQTFFRPEVILTNLLPYTEYVVKVEAHNQFTHVSAGGYLFGDSRKNRALEGGKLKIKCIVIYHHISCIILTVKHVLIYTMYMLYSYHKMFVLFKFVLNL